jgi:hypothetical protein
MLPRHCYRMRPRREEIKWGLLVGASAAAFFSVVSVSAALALGPGSFGSLRPVENAPPSADPYTASLAYARCMRAHGVPHPDPDKRGDFRLTAADERRMSRVDAGTKRRAERACFHTLKGLDLRPLSHQALARANKVIADFGRCLRAYGHKVGAPDAKNLGHGTASFGFKRVKRAKNFWQSAEGKRFLRDQFVCEKRVRMAKRLSAIIAQDRSPL